MDQAMLRALVNDLTDSSKMVSAKQQLIASGSDAIPVLIDVMNHGADKLAWRAASVLLQINEACAISALIEGLNSPNIVVQQVIAQGLGKSDDERVASALLAHLDTCPITAQLGIVESLGRLADPRTIQPLVEKLTGTDSPTLRQLIIKVLGKIGGESVVEVIRQFEDDENHHVRSRVHDALEAIRNQSTIS